MHGELLSVYWQNVGNHNLKILFRQICYLTISNLKTRYRNTLSGILWVVLYPTILYGAQAFVFHYILKLNVNNYLVFLLSGLLPWIFFVQSLEMNTTMIVNNARLIKSFPIHPIVPVTSQILDNLLNFSLSFLVILIPVLALTKNFHWSLVFLPLPILILLVAVGSLAFLLAICQVFFYDTKFVITFVLSIAFYLTPIFYPADFISPEMKWLLDFNPLVYLIAPFQTLLKFGDLFDFWRSLGFALVISGGVLILAMLVWTRKKHDLYFRL
jgi:lipopolysaccharide transport system permease protein